MERKEVLDFISDLKEASISNSHKSLIKYVKNSEILEKIKSGEQISLCEIKNVIIENLKIPSKDISIEETMELLKYLVYESGNFIYRIYFENIGDFNNKIFNITESEQIEYGEKIIEYSKNISFPNITAFFKSIGGLSQIKLLNTILKNYSNNSSIISEILYAMDEETKKELSFNKLKEILNILLKNQQDKQKVENIIQDLPTITIEDNLFDIILFIKEKGLSILNVFSSYYWDRNRNLVISHIYKKNIIKIIEIFSDNLSLTEEALSLYFEYVLSERSRRKAYGITQTDIELVSLIKKSIINGSTNHNLSDKEKILEYFRNNPDSKIIIHLIRCDKNFFSEMSENEKIDFFLQSENVYEYFNLEELFSNEFINNNVNKILKKAINNGMTPYEIRKIIEGLSQETCNIIEDNIFNYCLEEEIFTNITTWFKFYLHLSEKLKLKYFDELYTQIMNSRELWYGDYSKEKIIELLIIETPNQAYQDFSKQDWQKILDLSHNKLNVYFRYINDSNIKDELLNEYIKEFNQEDDCESISYRLSQFGNEVLKSKIDFICDECNINTKIALLHLLEPDEISDDFVLRILSESLSNINNGEILNRYNTLKKYNININKTIMPEVLSDEIYNKLGIEIILRISTNIQLQKELIKYKYEPVILEIIKKISIEKENWLEWIDYGLSYNVFAILKNAGDNNIKEITMDNIENCFKCSIDKENHFSIFKIGDIENYNEKKAQLCLEILKDSSACKKLYTSNISGIKDCPRIIQKKFAICELLFGMDHLCVENLVKKYAKDIQHISSSTLYKDEQETIELLSQMKTICEMDDLEEVSSYILNNADIVYQRMKKSKNSIDIENTLIKIFQSIYEKEIYKVSSQHNDSAKKINIYGSEYNVEVIRIRPKDNGFFDFKMFIRCEGAYDPNWKEPDNFKESINRPNIDYHGNCKSLIANNLLGFPKSKGPILGYSSTHICLAAPWDIISKSANTQLSIVNANWNIGRGIEFLCPNEMINSTRHSHNEFVSDRLVYNKEKTCYEKEMPDYIVWEQETLDEDKTEQDNSDLWRQTKKAAAQLGVPIVVINKEEIILSEQKKILSYLNRLTNLENEENIREIFENIITNFENNVVGIQFSDTLKEKYFTSVERINMYNIIDNIISKYRDTNPELYLSCIYIINELLQKEINNCRSNKGMKIAKTNIDIEKLLKKYNEMLDELKQTRQK